MSLVLATWALAIIAMAAIVYQVRETSRSRSAEALSGFREQWDSPDSRLRRRRLAAAVLDGMTVENLPATVIEDVMNFFEDLATSFTLRHLDKYAVWSCFYDDALHYWSAIGEAYARECRDDEKTSQEYRELERMIEELKTFERKKTSVTPVLDARDIREFLEAEAGLDQPIKLKSGSSI
jgi:hypothetical protein